MNEKIELVLKIRQYQQVDILRTHPDIEREILMLAAQLRSAGSDLSISRHLSQVLGSVSEVIQRLLHLRQTSLDCLRHT